MIRPALFIDRKNLDSIRRQYYYALKFDEPVVIVNQLAFNIEFVEWLIQFSERKLMNHGQFTITKYN